VRDGCIGSARKSCQAVSGLSFCAGVRLLVVWCCKEVLFRYFTILGLSNLLSTNFSLPFSPSELVSTQILVSYSLPIVWDELRGQCIWGVSAES
jgi:hypothetical protein